MPSSNSRDSPEMKLRARKATFIGKAVRAVSIVVDGEIVDCNSNGNRKSKQRVPRENGLEPGFVAQGRHPRIGSNIT